jgi:low affinity Fe/Cu permease
MGRSEPDHAVERLSRSPTRLSRAAHRIAGLAGSPATAAGAAVAIALWLVAGVVTGFPRAWELVATCGVPMFTLALVMVIQHTQNHNDRALQVKLDEIIRAEDDTNDEMMQVEDASERDLDRLQDHYAGQAEEAAARRRSAQPSR